MIFVAKIKQDHPDFYKWLGPFFGSRIVAKEVGIHLYDDPTKTWFIAFDGELLGFASLKKGLISDCYVLPKHRMKGIFKLVLDAMFLCSKGKLKANCTKASKKAFQNAGFVEIKKTKNFTYMELDRA